MIVLDTTTRKLEIVLAGAVTTNQLPFIATYQDSTVAPPATNQGASNNTTAVTAVAAPASGAQRRLRYFSVYNADTGSATVTVQLNDNGTTRAIVKMTLPVGTSLIFVHGVGWSVLPVPASGGGSSINFISTVTAKSANFTVAVGDKGTLYQVTTGAATITATLPAAATAAADWYILLEKADTGAGNIATSAAVVDSALLLLLQQYDMVVVWTDGTNYYANALLARVPSGGGGGDVVQIYDNLLSSAAANFDITSISGSYKQLRLVLYLRGTAAADGDDIKITFNNDSGANYDDQRSIMFNTSMNTASDTGHTYLELFAYPEANSLANAFEGAEILIPNYAATTGYKPVTGSSFGYWASRTNSHVFGGQWRNTAAITRITITPNSGNWAIGSRATLYGMN